jgi:hypothetical protein
MEGEDPERYEQLLAVLRTMIRAYRVSAATLGVR